MRMLRALALASTMVVAGAGAALAVGTGGVDMQLELEQADDGLVLLVDDEEATSGTIQLASRVDDDRTVEVYAVIASRGEAGGVTLGERGSAPWFGLDDQVVEIAGRERHAIAFEARPRLAPDGEELLAAVVLEARGGSTLVTQAVSLVRVAGPGATPLLWPWVVLAALLLTGLVAAHLRTHHDRRRAMTGPIGLGEIVRSGHGGVRVAVRSLT